MARVAQLIRTVQELWSFSYGWMQKIQLFSRNCAVGERIFIAKSYNS